MPWGEKQNAWGRSAVAFSRAVSEILGSIALMEVFVRHLFVSPGHNFFGHHGQPAGEHPTQEVDRIRCRSGRGVEGDRFFDYKSDYRGQITFFDFQVYAELKQVFAVSGLSAGAFRRNAVVEGMDLKSLIGARFSLGEAEFEGCAEASPCHWMNQAVAPGAEEWLKGRGGLRAKITRDGELSVGSVGFALTRGQMSL